MLQVAAPFWNQIAKMGPLTPFGERLFHLNQDQLTEANQQEYDQLLKEGVTPPVANAYLIYAPLIAEREAISRYTQINPSLRDALPEVNSVNEALRMALSSERLTPTEIEQLRPLLAKLRPTTQPA